MCCCCCCLRISYRLVVNLVTRLGDNMRDLLYRRRSSRSCTMPTKAEPAEEPTGVAEPADVARCQRPIVHPRRCREIYDTVELEPFYRDVDRRRCELLLRNSPDGTFLVRPFKLEHPTVRYILSVRGAGTYFHLFIRHAGRNGQYALGLEKPDERCFKFPADIVLHYQRHPLECHRAKVTTDLLLTPLANVPS